MNTDDLTEGLKQEYEAAIDRENVRAEQERANDLSDFYGAYVED